MSSEFSICCCMLMLYGVVVVFFGFGCLGGLGVVEVSSCGVVGLFVDDVLMEVFGGVLRRFGVFVVLLWVGGSG